MDGRRILISSSSFHGKVDQDAEDGEHHQGASSSSEEYDNRDEKSKTFGEPEMKYFKEHIVKNLPYHNK